MFNFDRIVWFNLVKIVSFQVGESHHKKINCHINEFFEYWKEDFMLMLIEHYKKYESTQQLVCTQKIYQWVNKYRMESDIENHFVDIQILTFRIKIYLLNQLIL